MHMKILATRMCPTEFSNYLSGGRLSDRKFGLLHRKQDLMQLGSDLNSRLILELQTILSSLRCWFSQFHFEHELYQIQYRNRIFHFLLNRTELFIEKLLKSKFYWSQNQFYLHVSIDCSLSSVSIKSCLNNLKRLLPSSLTTAF